MKEVLYQSDLDLALFLQSRRPSARERLRLPISEVRARKYDRETERQLTFIRGVQAATERWTA